MVKPFFREKIIQNLNKCSSECKKKNSAHKKSKSSKKDFKSDFIFKRYLLLELRTFKSLNSRQNIAYFIILRKYSYFNRL